MAKEETLSDGQVLVDFDSMYIDAQPPGAGPDDGAEEYYNSHPAERGRLIDILERLFQETKDYREASDTLRKIAPEASLMISNALLASNPTDGQKDSTVAEFDFRWILALALDRMHLLADSARYSQQPALADRFRPVQIPTA